MGGLGVKVQHFPLTLPVVLTTLTLPCERYVTQLIYLVASTTRLQLKDIVAVTK